MKFLNYIHGSRKGKDAHRIEKEAMDDPFLADAIEGYDSVPGNHADRIARMRSAITVRSVQRRPHGAWKIAVAAVAIIAAVSGYFTLMNHQASMLVAHESGNGYIDLYVPEGYVEQKRLELTAIQEDNPKKEITATSVADISNLHEVLSPIEPLRIYLPENYAQLHQKEVQELSRKRENIPSRTDTEEVLSSDVPMLASSQSVEKERNEHAETVDSHSDQYLDDNIGNTTIYLSQAANGVIKPRLSKKQSTANAASKQQVTLKGKIVDSNNEPLIGVSVVQKGTNNGTITDIDGNYQLNVDAENAPLTAYYVGYEKIDIPDPQNTKVVAMKENTSALDEVVVTGYGVSKKSMVTGAAVSVNSKDMSKSKPATIKPEPIAGMKEYRKYIEQNLTHPVDVLCKQNKGKVVLEFTVGIDGIPSDIKVIKSLCPAFDREAIRLLQSGPKWKLGNTTTRIDIKF